MGPIWTPKVQKIIKNHKNGYFSHILGIRAISPIHGIKFLIGTYMIECPKDKIIINRASGVYLGSKGPKHHQKSPKWPILANFGCFCDFLDLWSPDMTPYPTPDAIWIIISSLGHSTMSVPMRHLIQCMGDMALMPKICGKKHLKKWFLGPLVPGYDSISYSRRPMNDYFIYGTLNQSCIYHWKIRFNVWAIRVN